MVLVPLQCGIKKDYKHPEDGHLRLLEELEDECRELVQRHIAIQEEIAQRVRHSSSVAGAFSETLAHTKCELRSLADRQLCAKATLADLTNEAYDLLREEQVLVEEIGHLQVQVDIKNITSEMDTGFACPRRTQELKQRSSMLLQMQEAECASDCNELRIQAADWVDFLNFRQERVKDLSAKAVQLTFDKEELDAQAFQVLQHVQSRIFDEDRCVVDEGAIKVSERCLTVAQRIWQVSLFLPFTCTILASILVKENTTEQIISEQFSHPIGF